MEDEEFEVEYKPYTLTTRVPINGKQDYRLSTWQDEYKPYPQVTEFDKFIQDMREYLINNLPKKTQTVKQSNPIRQDNIGGFTNFAINQHVERIKNGGNI